MFPSEITNLIVMSPNKNDLQELPGIEVKTKIISMVRKDTNILQENKSRVE